MHCVSCVCVHHCYSVPVHRRSGVCVPVPFLFRCVDPVFVYRACLLVVFVFVRTRTWGPHVSQRCMVMFGYWPQWRTVTFYSTPSLCLIWTNALVFALSVLFQVLRHPFLFPMADGTTAEDYLHTLENLPKSPGPDRSED